MTVSHVSSATSSALATSAIVSFAISSTTSLADLPFRVVSLCTSLASLVFCAARNISASCEAGISWESTCCISPEAASSKRC